jgi:superfamily II DNA or RNA helicase
MAEVHKLMSDRMLRLKVSDIPGFPTSQLEPKLVDLEDHDREELVKAYAEMEDRMKSNGTIPLTEMLRARERAEFSKAAFMAESAADLVDEGTSVVIFSCFRSTLKRIKEKLAEYDVGTIGEIHGDQTSEERQEWIDEFQANKCHVILVMTQAGGTGLSLHDEKQERPRASLITPGVSASEFLQALGRIHRVGGTPVVQTLVLAAGTIEERIYEAVTRKVGCVNSLNDGDLTGQ